MKLFGKFESRVRKITAVAAAVGMIGNPSIALAKRPGAAGVSSAAAEVEQALLNQNFASGSRSGVLAGAGLSGRQELRVLLTPRGVKNEADFQVTAEGREALATVTNLTLSPQEKIAIVSALAYDQRLDLNLNHVAADHQDAVNAMLALIFEENLDLHAALFYLSDLWKQDLGDIRTKTMMDIAGMENRTRIAVEPAAAGRQELRLTNTQMIVDKGWVTALLDFTDNTSDEVIEFGIENGVRGFTTNPFSIATSLLKKTDPNLQSILAEAPAGLTGRKLLKHVYWQRGQQIARHPKLREMFYETKGVDGWVSVEVDPTFAYLYEVNVDEKGGVVPVTRDGRIVIREELQGVLGETAENLESLQQRLHKDGELQARVHDALVDAILEEVRLIHAIAPNVAVKIANTRSLKPFLGRSLALSVGQTVLERATAEGITTNFTLIFGLEDGQGNQAAWRRGKKQAKADGTDTEQNPVRGFNSYFVSRIDPWTLANVKDLDYAQGLIGLLTTLEAYLLDFSEETSNDPEIKDLDQFLIPASLAPKVPGPADLYMRALIGGGKREALTIPTETVKEFNKQDAKALKPYLAEARKIYFDGKKTPAALRDALKHVVSVYFDQNAAGMAGRLQSHYDAGRMADLKSGALDANQAASLALDEYENFKESEDLEKMLDALSLDGDKKFAVPFLQAIQLVSKARAELRQQIILGAEDTRYDFAAGTAGIRSLDVDGFTLANAGVAGIAFVQDMRERFNKMGQTGRIRLAVAYDARPGHREYSERAFLAALPIARQLNVELQFVDQIVPVFIPMELTQADAPADLRADAVLFWTASHNPIAGYNKQDQLGAYRGAKILINGTPLPKKEWGSVTKLAKAVQSYELASSSDPDAQPAQVDWIGYSVNRLKETIDWDAFVASLIAYKKQKPNFRVVVDPMHGSTAPVVARLYDDQRLRDAGILVEVRRTTTMDKERPDYATNPETGEPLKDAKGRLRPWGPDPTDANMRGKLLPVSFEEDVVTLINDGDGDRMVSYESGLEIKPNPIGGAFTDFTIEEDWTVGNGVVRTAPTSHIIDFAGDLHGRKTLKTAVGSGNFADPLSRQEAESATEESGHIALWLKKKLFFDNSVAEGVLMLHMIATRQSSFNGIIDNLWSRISEKSGVPRLYDIRTAMDPAKVTDDVKTASKVVNANPKWRDAFMNELARRLGKQLLVGHAFIPTFELEDEGGLRVNFTDFSSVSGRGSGTEPIYRLYAEAPSEADSFSIAKAYGETIEWVTAEILANEPKLLGRAELRSWVPATTDALRDAIVNAWHQTLESKRGGEMAQVLYQRNRTELERLIELAKEPAADARVKAALITLLDDPASLTVKPGDTSLVVAVRGFVDQLTLAGENRAELRSTPTVLADETAIRVADQSEIGAARVAFETPLAISIADQKVSLTPSVPQAGRVSFVLNSPVNVAVVPGIVNRVLGPQDAIQTGVISAAPLQTVAPGTNFTLLFNRGYAVLTLEEITETGVVLPYVASKELVVAWPNRPELRLNPPAAPADPAKPVANQAQLLALQARQEWTLQQVWEFVAFSPLRNQVQPDVFNVLGVNETVVVRLTVDRNIPQNPVVNRIQVERNGTVNRNYDFSLTDVARPFFGNIFYYLNTHIERPELRFQNLDTVTANIARGFSVLGFIETPKSAEAVRLETNVAEIRRAQTEGLGVDDLRPILTQVSATLGEINTRLRREQETASADLPKPPFGIGSKNPILRGAALANLEAAQTQLTALLAEPVGETRQELRLADAGAFTLPAGVTREQLLKGLAAFSIGAGDIVVLGEGVAIDEAGLPAFVYTERAAKAGKPIGVVTANPGTENIVAEFNRRAELRGDAMVITAPSLPDLIARLSGLAFRTGVVRSGKQVEVAAYISPDDQVLAETLKDNLIQFKIVTRQMLNRLADSAGLTELMARFRGFVKAMRSA